MINNLQRIFDEALQRLHKARGVPAIDDAMVAAERQVHALPDLDLAVDRHKLVLDLVDRDDCDLEAG